MPILLIENAKTPHAINIITLQHILSQLLTGVMSFFFNY